MIWGNLKRFLGTIYNECRRGMFTFDICFILDKCYDNISDHLTG